MSTARQLGDDPRALRALAHPLRQRILDHLHRQGPATSAMLATVLGADRGATSFHLRQLGKYGFAEVDVERSQGRRKFWRVVRQDLRLPKVERGQLSPDVAEIARWWFEPSLEALGQFVEEGDPWFEAATLSSARLHLTEAELARFGEEYIALVTRYGRPVEDAPAGARPIAALCFAFPPPDPDLP